MELSIRFEAARTGILACSALHAYNLTLDRQLKVVALKYYSMTVSNVYLGFQSINTAAYPEDFFTSCDGRYDALMLSIVLLYIYGVRACYRQIIPIIHLHSNQNRVCYSMITDICLEHNSI
jgi:hypothetical protein